MRSIPRTAMIILGIVLIVGIAKGTIALMIPILAIMIPIIAIISHSPIGKAIAESISGNSSGVSAQEFIQLKEKYNNLESRFNEYDEEMNRMREAIIFAEPKKISASSESSEHKNKINQQINLEKTL
jgi:hypothetical protein